eukprot:TRINITY_DN19403_c0_g1_i1.p3 TRINITY_DN19403_c0_g1~~TRINITY_DN19403_c0_g1_i1.p3  ORF type:complete len:193 (+),score=37.56 TRINITY_DN19403_c0_g1_i1:47-625(+)
MITTVSGLVRHKDRAQSLLTLVIHWFHIMLVGINWVWYVKNDGSLPDSMINAYMSFFIISSFFFYAVASVFYYWAIRHPLPEWHAKRRRFIGIVVNLVFCDVPLFFCQVAILWRANLKNFYQGVTFLFTCVSLLYSIVRLWTYGMIRCIKRAEERNAARKADMPHFDLNFAHSHQAPGTGSPPRRAPPEQVI